MNFYFQIFSFFFLSYYLYLDFFKMSESNTVIGINFGTAYTSIGYINKVSKKQAFSLLELISIDAVYDFRKVALTVLPTKKVTDKLLLLSLSTVKKK